MKMRKIPAAMPPATSMKTPVGRGQTNRERAEMGMREQQTPTNPAASTEQECRNGVPVLLSGRPSFFNQLLLTTAAVNHTLLIENHNCTKPLHKLLYGTLPQSTHADTKTTIFVKVLDKKALQYLTTAVFVQSLLTLSLRRKDHTCHVFKGECGWGIAP